MLRCTSPFRAWSCPQILRHTFFAACFLLVANGASALTLAIDGTPAIAGTCDTPTVLPDILITETQAGSLTAGTRITLGASYTDITRFDLSYATLTASRHDTGANVDASVIVPNSLQTDNAPAPDNAPDLSFQLAAASTSQTGPWQWRLRGVLAQINTSSGISGGDITLRIGTNDGTAIRALDQIQAFPDSTPAGDLRVAYRASTSCPTWPVLRIGPITAQQIVIPSRTIPVSAPSGASYVPFVAAHFNGNWFALTPQRQWQAFSTCQNITAALPTQGSPMPAIPLLPAATDLSTLSGLELWTGWGQSVDGLTTTEQACQNMLRDQLFGPLLTLP